MPYLGAYASLLLSVVFARLFFQVGASEYGSGYITCLLSLLLSVLTIFVLSSRLLTLVMLQILLFCGLWAYNCLSYREKLKR